MLDFESLPGNNALKSSLQSALHRRFPQAVLLSGPDGSGKSHWAHTIAAALLCTGSGEHPCTVCPSCRKMAHQTHPDFIVIDEGDNEIKVDTARRIREEAAILPNDGDRKVFWIAHADHMNSSAQNALLKVLEEPPRYVFFLLTACQPGALLQTIRSRCTLYQLEPPHAAPIDTPELLEPARMFLHALARGDEYGMLLGANGFAKANKATFQQAMTILGTAVRDAALVSSGCPPLLPALTTETCALAGALTTAKLLALYDHFALLSRRAEFNASAPIQCAVLVADAFQIGYAPRSDASPSKRLNKNGGNTI